MIQIRSGVFESNSSSTHSLCIGRSPVKKEDIPKRLYICGDEYGWSADVLDTPEERASYLFSALNEMRPIQFPTKDFTDYLDSIGIDYTLKMNKYDGVDHVGELWDFLYRCKNDHDYLTRFLFNPLSKVFTGNDSYVEEANCFIADDDYESYTGHKHPRRDDKTYEYYFKGN